MLDGVFFLLVASCLYSFISADHYESTDKIVWTRWNACKEWDKERTNVARMKWWQIEEIMCIRRVRWDKRDAVVKFFGWFSNFSLFLHSAQFHSHVILTYVSLIPLIMLASCFLLFSSFFLLSINLPWTIKSIWRHLIFVQRETCSSAFGLNLDVCVHSYMRIDQICFSYFLFGSDEVRKTHDFGWRDEKTQQRRMKRRGKAQPFENVRFLWWNVNRDVSYV